MPQELELPMEDCAGDWCVEIKRCLYPLRIPSRFGSFTEMSLSNHEVPVSIYVVVRVIVVINRQRSTLELSINMEISMETINLLFFFIYSSRRMYTLHFSECL